MKSALRQSLQPESSQEVAVARRRYAELLRAPTLGAKEVEELKRLMVCLTKTAMEVDDDQTTLRRVQTLRANIKAARDIQPQIATSHEASVAWNAETKQLIVDRQPHAVELDDAHARIRGTYNSGQDAVEEINKLKSNPLWADLLAHEPAASDVELKPISTY